jgi:hypothetical protein
VVIGKRCVHPCIFRAQELSKKKGRINERHAPAHGISIFKTRVYNALFSET